MTQNSQAELWVQKYKPSSLAAVKGQEKAVEQIVTFLKQFPGKKRALLLHGPPGSGKSSSVVAVAKELGYELLEFNASDKRNKGMVEELVGNAAMQQSLFMTKKLILLDEVDGVSGNDDRGGLAALKKILDVTPTPIIMTANEGDSDKLKPIKKNVVAVGFEKLNYLVITEILEQMLKAENIKYDLDAVKQLSRQADGDLRAAINDCEMISRHGNSISMQTLQMVMIREKEEPIEDALFKVFKNKNGQIASQAFERVQEDPDRCLLWVEGNIAKEYSGKDLAEGFEWIAAADIFRRRIIRQQYWRYLAYVSLFMSAGVAVSKTEKNPKIVTYSDNKRFLSQWILKQKYAKRDSIAAKLSETLHQPKREIIKEWPFYARIMKVMDDSVLEGYDLDPEEIEWFREKGQA